MLRAPSGACQGVHRRRPAVGKPRQCRRRSLAGAATRRPEEAQRTRRWSSPLQCDRHSHTQSQHPALRYNDITVIRLLGDFNNTPFQILHCYHRAKKAMTIQYVYKKCGTLARVFSQTLAHGNSKNEIRQTQRKKASIEARHRKQYSNRKKKSRRLTLARTYRPPKSLLSEAVNE